MGHLINKKEINIPTLIPKRKWSLLFEFDEDLIYWMPIIFFASANDCIDSLCWPALCCSSTFVRRSFTLLVSWMLNLPLGRALSIFFISPGQSCATAKPNRKKSNKLRGYFSLCSPRINLKFYSSGIQKILQSCQAAILFLCISHPSYLSLK